MIQICNPGCNSFWTEPDISATMKVEGPGDFDWTLTEIINGDDIINNNQPCIDILDLEPPEEEYIKYSKYA